MRKRNEKPVGQLLQEMMKAYRMNDKLDETTVKNNWGDLVGEMVAKNTEKLYIKNNILYVQITSPTIRLEVSYHVSMILERIHHLLKNKDIKDIKLK